MSKKVNNSIYDLDYDQYIQSRAANNLYSFFSGNSNGMSDYLSALQNISGGYLPDGSSYSNPSNSAVKKGQAFSYTDIAKNYLEYASTMDERNYNEYLYQKYESPASMVSQYEEAGLNSAMMYGQSASVGGSVNSSGGVEVAPTTGSQANNPLDWLSSIMGTLVSVAGVANQAKANKVNEYNAETQRIVGVSQAKKNESETEGQDIENWVADQTKLFKVEFSKISNDKVISEIDRIKQDISESKVRIPLLEAQTDLTKEQKNEVLSLIRLNDLNSDKLEAFKPYWARMAAAELAYTQAKTVESREEAKKIIEETASIGFSNAVQSGLFNVPVTDDGEINWTELMKTNPQAAKILEQINRDIAVNENEIIVSDTQTTIEGSSTYQGFEKYGGQALKVLDVLAKFLVLGSFARSVGNKSGSSVILPNKGQTYSAGDVQTLTKEFGRGYTTTF